MRNLLLQLLILQGKPHPIAAQAPESNMNETVTEWSPALVTEAQQNIREKDLDSCLSVFLSCLQRMNSVLTVDATVIDYMSSLLVFDCAETVARVRCISDAQNVIDIIDLLTNNESFTTRCGPEAARKAAHLASAIFARVPLLQRSLFLNKPDGYLEGNLFPLETVFISKILDHNYVLPVLGIYHDQDQFGYGIVFERIENAAEWLRRSRPNFITRMRVMFEIARIIRYIHSMGIALYAGSIELGCFFLDSNFRVKIKFMGLFTWCVREATICGRTDSVLWPPRTPCTCESNISDFAMLFHRVCFGGHNENFHSRLGEPALQLIERCRDSQSRPTMEDVIKEMETWNLT
ncbi:hypothetical protein M378DRAFT_919280 [Amanita muscaria Koide BX008]|uniref:Protein kinase domain-containing protein n=1 Tax=Amanita muscaria (strain Koide BX008) TaxID=946122 RepID=A0A0C2T1Q6_AMAMK|nr:hypothetical protein M378DRAFT_919280 [Amanita muscaria Koide BX008]